MESEKAHHTSEKKDMHAERNATIFAFVAIVVILISGCPCFCYFGAGLFQGIHILQTGHTNNPVRQNHRKYKREKRYDPVFPKPAKSQ